MSSSAIFVVKVNVLVDNSNVLTEFFFTRLFPLKETATSSHSSSAVFSVKRPMDAGLTVLAHQFSVDEIAGPTKQGIGRIGPQ